MMLKNGVTFGYSVFFLYLCTQNYDNMKKICLLNCFGDIINGIRLDSGAATAGSYSVPSVMDLSVQHRSEIVVKIKNINLLPHEKVKFTELKKLK